MLSVELTSRCSCYVFRQYFLVKRVQCPPDSSAILFKQPKQLNLVPRFPRSMVQYDGSIWQLSCWLFWIMRVVFLPNQKQEIFWMNNNNGYWTVYIMDSRCTCYCTPCKWRSCTLVGYSTAKFFTFLPCLYSVILWS